MQNQLFKLYLCTKANFVKLEIVHCMTKEYATSKLILFI